MNREMDRVLLDAARRTKGFMPDDEGLALYRAALTSAADAGLAAGPLLEVGAYCGKSTVYLGAAARVAGSVVFSLDHHRGSEENRAGWEHHDESLVDPITGRMDTLATFRRTIDDAGLDDVVAALVGRSETVAPAWATPLRFLFIDGGHGVEPAAADYRLWTRFVVIGGLLAIHDVFPDPADGGQAPYDEIYRPAVAGGRFAEVKSMSCGSLRVLVRA